MTTVTLEQLWVHDANNEATYKTAWLSSLDESPSITGGPRTMASGAVRHFSRTGTVVSLSVSLELVARTTVDQLREWIGTVVMLREPRGRKLWGTFDALTVSEVPGADTDTVNVSFTFQQTTHTEVV